MTRLIQVMPICLLALIAGACASTPAPPADNDAVLACRDRLPQNTLGRSRITVGDAPGGGWRVRAWTRPGAGTTGMPDYECRVTVRDGTAVVSEFRQLGAGAPG
jgi:hypothetical protein